MLDSCEDVSRPEDSLKAGNLWTSRVVPINVSKTRYHGVSFLFLYTSSVGHYLLSGMCLIYTPVPDSVYSDVGFEAVTAVVMKISIFWDITACIPLKVNRRFGGT
jgi:hypothetical protein